MAQQFDGLAALEQSEFGLEPLSGHLFTFISRRGRIAQILSRTAADSVW
jgi:IS66 Orf2 like protein